MSKTAPPEAGTGAVFPERYEEQLADKVAKVKDLFAGQRLPEIEVHRSSTANYRMRTEFTVWHEDGDLFYVMFEQAGADADAAGAAADTDAAPDTAAAAPAAAAAMAEEAGPSGNGQADAADISAAVAGSEGDAADAAAGAGAQQSNGQPKGQSAKKSRHKKQQQQQQQQRPDASSLGSRKRMTRVRIDEFPVASQMICTLMPLLRQELMGSDCLRHKLFQVNFHTTLSNQAIITLQYHKQVGAGEVLAGPLPVR
jgi:hypothetical protein